MLKQLSPKTGLAFIKDWIRAKATLSFLLWALLYVKKVTKLSSRSQILALPSVHGVSALGLVWLLLLSTSKAHARMGFNSDRSTELQSAQILPQPRPDPNVLHQPLLVIPGLDDQNPDRGEVQIWSNSISYTREVDFHRYFVQPNLRFGVDYTYNFSISASAADSQGRPMALPDGFYRVQMAVLLPNLNAVSLRAAGIRNLSAEERYITSASFVTRLRNGQLNKKVTLRFPNVTATTLMSHLVVEVVPLKSNCQRTTGSAEIQTYPCIALGPNREVDVTRSWLEAQPGVEPLLIETPFLPFMSISPSQRDPSDPSEVKQIFRTQTLTQYVHKARTLQTQKALESLPSVAPESFAQADRAHLFSVDSFPGPFAAQVREHLKLIGFGTIEIPRGSLDFFRELCRQIIDTNKTVKLRLAQMSNTHVIRGILESHINRCAHAPEKHLSLSRVTHVGRLNNEIAQRPLFSHRENFNMLVNFMVSRSRSVDTFTGWTVKPQALLVKPLEAFGIPIPMVLDWSHSVNVSNSRAQSESVSGSLSSFLDFNVSGMEFSTLDSKVCLRVKPLSENNWPYYDPAPDAKNGLYICDTQPRDTKIREIFVHVFKRASETSTVDPWSALTQTINLGLRGDSEISRFFYLIRTNISPKHDNRVMPFQSLDKAEAYFAVQAPTLPRVVVNPLSFGGDSAPSFSEKILNIYQESFVSEQ